MLDDSGTAARPVRVGAYGDPDRPAPRIDAAGAQQAVLLSDAEYVRIADLELTADLTGSFTVDLPQSRTFDQIRPGEDIARGQHVEQFAVDAWNGSYSAPGRRPDPSVGPPLG
ncbi:hypothetical protein [Streptomyces sp. NPDC018000]|uniref:hypothetical protein n=1 Tax=Streptomyces sp. NPDC018000 TaxID=3365028 RepID=UPI0037AB9E08